MSAGITDAEREAMVAQDRDKAYLQLDAANESLRRLAAKVQELLAIESTEPTGNTHALQLAASKTRALLALSTMTQAIK